MKMSLPHFRFLLASAALGLPSIAGAQTPDSARLPNIVVTATKTPADKARLSVPVTVITGAELRTKGITRVLDALREAPGVSIVQNGAAGSVASIFLRGGESRYTKVLLDGVPLNEPGGYMDLSHLTTDNIERIEIVRGPASVVYGADAVVGVIQIFTRSGGGPARTSVAARTGTRDTRDLELGTAGQSGMAGYALGGGFHATSGLHSFNNDYRNGTLSGSLSVPVQGVANFRLNSRYTTAEYHYPTDYTGQPVDTNSYRVQHRLIAAVQADRDLTSSLRLIASAGANDLRDLSEDIEVPFGSKNRVNTAYRSIVFRRFADARITAQLPGAAAATVGAAYQREREATASLERSLGGGPRTETGSFGAARTNSALYGELLGEVATRVNYTLSGRLDRNSDFGNFFTHSSGVSVLVFPGSRLRASYGTAFNAPSFFQLNPTLYTVGNPDLDAERSSSWQVGVEQDVRPGVTVAGTLFRQRFNGLIQYVSGGPPTYLGSFANLAAASANGSEVEVTLIPGMWDANLAGITVRANYSEVRPKVTRLDKSYAGSLKVGQALIRRPTHSGSVSLSYTEKIWNMSVLTNYMGRRPDVDFSEFPSPTVTLASYTRIDFAANIALAFMEPGMWTATAKIENLAGHRYQEVFRYDAPRRMAYLGFRWGSGIR